jgi:hypothetical protein
MGVHQINDLIHWLFAFRYRPHWKIMEESAGNVVPPFNRSAALSSTLRRCRSRWGKGISTPSARNLPVDFSDQGALDDAAIIEIGNPHPQLKIQRTVPEIQEQSTTGLGILQYLVVFHGHGHEAPA